MYKVVKNFTDLMDDGYKYKVGDEFPRKGAKVSSLRIARLSSNNNRQKVALIEEVKEPKMEITTPAQSEMIEQSEEVQKEPARPRKKKND